MAIKQMLSCKEPGAMFEMLMQSNPNFRKFIESNRGKSVEQIAQENGIDSSVLHQLLG